MHPYLMKSLTDQRIESLRGQAPRRPGRSLLERAGTRLSTWVRAVPRSRRATAPTSSSAAQAPERGAAGPVGCAA